MTAANSDRLVRRICIGIMLVTTAEFVIATTGVQINNLPPSTDFATYYLAAAQTRDHRSPYDRGAIAARGRALGFGYDQFPFLYPPPFALAMQPLAHLSYEEARQVWMLLTTAWLLAAMAFTVRLVRRNAAWLGIVNPGPVWMLLAAFFAAALNSTSVHNDIRAGSVGALLFACMAAMALAMLPAPPAPRPATGTPVAPEASRSNLASDMLLAGAICLATWAKLVPVVLLPFVAWRGRRRAAGIALLGLALSMVPAIVHWGPGIITAYVRDAILPGVRDEVAPPMNQSLDAVLSRFLVPSAWVNSPFDAPGLKRVLSVMAAAVVGWATLRRLAARRRAAALVPLELGFVVLALLALMKLTWVQTLAAMLFVWPVLMLAVLRAGENGAPWARRLGLAACVGFFFSSAHVPILWPALRHGPLVAVTAVHLVGVLILWAAADFVLRHERETLGPAWQSGA